MCSPTASVGVTQDTGRGAESVGATASHELGHIMNMQHDDACKSWKNSFQGVVLNLFS